MLLFLPRYFKRAEQNAAVGLGAALEFLVDLVSLLQTERRFSKVTARFIGCQYSGLTPFRSVLDMF